MKIKKILSLILAVALVWTCAPSYLPAAEAVAETTPTVIYTVGDLGVEEAVIVDTIDAAFAKISEKNKQWAADAAVEIRFKGEIRGGAENSLLFGQTTVWRNNGTKLPITLLGVDTKIKYDASIVLDAIGGWYACANDYTFKNLSLTIGDRDTKFYAGSGNIVFEDVFFLTPTPRAIQTEQDQTEVYTYALNLAKYICEDEADLIEPEISRIPAGDAWQVIRAWDKLNGTDYGQGLCGTEAKGYWGDGAHEGDIGGGQYLSACVYFETLTRLDCRGNTWRPAYTLCEDMITLLQNAAHEAVSEVYGDDYYVDVTDAAGSDDEFNILILGSSNCAYLRDELQYIAEHATGKNTRVIHAYSSGVLMNTQWSWVENGNGSYSLFIVEDGAETKVEEQDITEFLTDYTWDSIITYQSTGGLNKDLPYSDEGFAKILDSCEKADDFFNYIYNNGGASTANAKYYWFQNVAVPYGVPSIPDGATEGKIYADNCTQAAFAGWDPLQPGEKVTTSITFGKNVTYKDNANTDVAAVGYLKTTPETPYTDSTARNVTYLEATGYDDIADIRPADVEAKIIIDGDYATLGRVCCKAGYAPTDASVILKNGGAYKIIGMDPDATGTFYGDVEVEFAGGTTELTAFINKSMTGDAKMIFSGITVADNSTAIAGGCTLDGDLTLEVRDGSINSRMYVCGNGSSGAQITGTAKFRWGGGYIKQIQTGRGTTIGTLVNEFYTNPDAKTPATTGNNFNLAGYSSCVVTGDICNNFIGQIPTGIMSRMKWTGGDGDHTRIINTVKADANGNVHTFASYCGGITAGTVKEIVNNIEAGNFTAFNGGSTVATGTTKITNNISGGTFSANTVFGGADNATVNTVITGGTFAFDPSANVATGYEAVENEDGTYTVENAFKPGLFVEVRPVKTVYNVGEELDVSGLVLKLVNTDGTEEYIDDGFTVAGFDSAAVGKTTVTVTYGDKTVEMGLSVVDATIDVVDDSGNVYTDFIDAVKDCEEAGILTLLRDVSGDVTIEKDLSIELNGKEIDGTITVADGCTLYGADASTDDYTIEDGEGYIKIKVVRKGNGKVEGMPASMENDGYLAVTEGEYVSFHRVNLRINYMTLRAKDTGVYFKSAFAGDELVAERIEEFGIVMSVLGEPTEENLMSGVGFSRFDGANFEAGVNMNDATSTLLRGVMKETNASLINKRNANLPVYGRAYVRLKDGTYMLGKTVVRTFREQVEGADAIWDTLAAEQKLETLKMYSAFKNVMTDWKIPNMDKEPMQLEDPSKDDTLNILMIGNSFCYYYVEELYGMLTAAGYEDVNICNVYYASCSLEKHWNWWKSGKANYNYYTTNESGRNGVEKVNLEWCLQQQNWDVISLQESSSGVRDSGGAEVHLEKTRLWRTELWGYLKEQFPQSRHLWHQVWSYQIGYDRNNYQMNDSAQQKTDMQAHRDFALAVCEEDVLERVNSGEAWQIVREGGYDNMCARLAIGNGVGDYYHDGDIGGGQYLNACVWFEALTGQSCIGNTWRPPYTLDETLISTFQQAAHKAIEQRNAEDVKA